MSIANYKELKDQAAALIQDVPYFISNLANISALLFQSLEDINWAGFYIVRDKSLILGPFQGKPACIRIPFGAGVCGTAAETDTTQLVPNVHLFSGHIACDGASNSEIVIPIHLNGKVVGVLDIDSPLFSRFTEDDRLGLEGIVKQLEMEMLKQHNDLDKCFSL